MKNKDFTAKPHNMDSFFYVVARGKASDFGLRSYGVVKCEGGKFFAAKYWGKDSCANVWSRKSTAKEVCETSTSAPSWVPVFKTVEEAWASVRRSAA